MTDTPTEPTIEQPVEPEQAVEAPTEAVEPAEEPDTFPRAYVEQLRSEAKEGRIKAAKMDEANARLIAAYAQATGRLLDTDALPLSPDLLDDNGLADPAKVSAAVDELLAAKPFLAKRTPTTPIALGVRQDTPAELGWLDVLRGAR